MPITGHNHRDVQRERKAVWLLPAALEADILLADLGRTFPLTAEQPRRTTATWFDTFDWRLYSRGILLYHDRTAWRLLNRDLAEEVAALDAPGQDGWGFCQEFPVSRVRSLLEPLLAERRLLRLFSNETTTIDGRILNGDGKTVAQVMAETHQIGSEPAIATIRLQEVRGYGRDFDEVSDFFSNYGIREQVNPYFFFAQGVRSNGRSPLDYTAKFRPALRPEMTARQAMVTVYSDLLATMRRNEAGVIEDLDTEFLHDFRVAVRRTRSGLGQVREVLPAGATDTFRQEFAWLGEITGPCRDLDVYLFEENRYRTRLPEKLQPGLAPFFAELRSRRASARQRLVRQLRAKKYRKLTTAWQEFLDSGGEGEVTKNSGLPVAQLARRIIARRFRRLLRAGRAIHPASPAEEYHRLRIQGKKLRYTLEFFSALLPEEELELVIKELKRLQDNLGAYNDLAVQQGQLREYLAGLRLGSRRNLEQAAAIGGLLSSLDREQRQVREEFAGRFAEFSRPESTELYRRFCRRAS